LDIPKEIIATRAYIYGLHTPLFTCLQCPQT